VVGVIARDHRPYEHHTKFTHANRWATGGILAEDPAPVGVRTKGSTDTILYLSMPPTSAQTTTLTRLSGDAAPALALPNFERTGHQATVTV
jgi:hypothetical protein